MEPVPGSNRHRLQVAARGLGEVEARLRDVARCSRRWELVARRGD